MDIKKRSSFSGKLGFILAAAGSAVGLGNIWRFPYLAAKYGGGMFLLVYIALSVTFGFALMVAEVAIGRKTKTSAIGAYRQLDKRFTFVGVLGSVIPALILPYYAVIGGWVTKYFAGFCMGQTAQMADSDYFNAYIGSSETVWDVAEPLLWFALFIGVTALIVLCGVEKGIEKVSKLMMPALVVLILFVAIYSLCTLDGAMEGLLYYIKPDFSKFSFTTVIAATGQLFYSMSLAMGIMITFGSYMKKDVNIEKATHSVEIFDTGIAFLAGLMIVPAVFAFSGGDESALSQGPGLMFVTLPKVFQAMPAGTVIGAVFFLMVLFAALTSAISLMETVVSILCDKFHWRRKPCCLLVLGFSLLLGAASSLGYSAWGNFRIFNMQLLDFFDFITNSVLMPIVAFVTCIFVGYVLGTQPLIDEVELSGKFKQKRMFSVIIRYVAPICILLILASSVLGAFGIFQI